MFEWITGIIQRLGYFGVATLAFVEHLFPPIPSELVIPLAGFIAAQGDLRVDLVIAAATLGSTAGTAVWYVVGRRLGEARLRRWVDRFGWLLTLTPGDVDRAQQWFRRHGRAAVLIGRLIPGVRSLISLPAGFTRMPLLPFLLYSAAGSLAWTTALASAGVALGAHATVVGDWVDIGTNIVLAVVAGLLLRRYLRYWGAGRGAAIAGR